MSFDANSFPVNTTIRTYSLQNNTLDQVDLQDLPFDSSLNPVFSVFNDYLHFQTLAPNTDDPVAQEQYANFQRELRDILSQLIFEKKTEIEPKKKALRWVKAKKSMDCPICYQKCKRNSRVCHLTCGHSFHHGCISKWISRSQTCPLCRHKID